MNHAVHELDGTKKNLLVRTNVFLDYLRTRVRISVPILGALFCICCLLIFLSWPMSDDSSDAATDASMVADLAEIMDADLQQLEPPKDVVSAGSCERCAHYERIVLVLKQKLQKERRDHKNTKRRLQRSQDKSLQLEACKEFLFFQI